MKKLMFTAAVAAMGAGAFAAESHVAQVYDMVIKVKSTTCAGSTNKMLTDACGNNYYFYRTQKTYRFDGKFWGCGCATIASPIADQYGQPDLDATDLEDWDCENNANSYMFWASEGAFHFVDFQWKLLQLCGKKTSNVEGYFNADFYGCSNGEVNDNFTLHLDGAGYGTAKIFSYTDEDGEKSCSPLLNQIKSMEGRAVGIYNVVDGAKAVGCAYCGTTADCLPVQFCECIGLYEEGEGSAAFGTWSLKFNSTLANKVMAGKTIDQAYKFPTFVTEEFDCIAAGVTPVKTDCEKATAKLTTLEAQLDALETSRATLLQQTAAYQEIIYQCDTTNATLELHANIAKVNYNDQTNDNANAEWFVNYKNGSGDDVYEAGTNLVTFTALITKIQTRVLTFDYANYDGNELTSLDSAASFAQEEAAATKELAETLEEAEAALVQNAAKRNVATQGIADNAEKLAALDYDNTKAQLNAQIGAQKVVVDQACD